MSLSPASETLIREYAARDGVSIDELIQRTFTPRQPQPNAKALAFIAAIRKWQSEDELGRRDQERIELQTNLDHSRRQAGMRTLFPELGKTE